MVMRTSVLAAALVTGAVFVAPVAAAAPGGCGALGGVVDSGACRIQVGDPGYTVNVAFPIGYPDEQAIVDYLGQTMEGFVNLAQSPGARNLPYEMTVTPESFRSSQTRSVVLTLFQDVGSAHPTTWYKSFTDDVRTGRPVTFDTLFAADTTPLDAIFPIVRNTLAAETGLTVSAGDGRDPSRYQNFAVTDDAVIFFFGQAELLPSFAGPTSVSLPRNVIPPLAL
jgi:hypothetical protein